MDGNIANARENKHINYSQPAHFTLNGILNLEEQTQPLKIKQSDLDYVCQNKKNLGNKNLWSLTRNPKWIDVSFVAFSPNLRD